MEVLVLTLSACLSEVCNNEFASTKQIHHRISLATTMQIFPKFHVHDEHVKYMSGIFYTCQLHRNTTSVLNFNNSVGKLKQSK